MRKSHEVIAQSNKHNLMYYIFIDFIYLDYIILHKKTYAFT